MMKDFVYPEVVSDFVKTIQIIVVLTLIGCSSPIDRQTISNQKDSLNQVTITDNYEALDISSRSVDREYLDSAHFHIIRGKYVSGAKFTEVYENKLTKLDDWKEYYENGELKEEGMMTNAHHIHVGLWKYYSATGKLDSIIDYDKKYSISYFDALKIAEKKGFKMPYIEVTLQVDSLKAFWQIARWTENEDHSGQTAEAILIDTQTGKVAKPKYQLMGIY